MADKFMTVQAVNFLLFERKIQLLRGLWGLVEEAGELGNPAFRV